MSFTKINFIAMAKMTKTAIIAALADKAGKSKKEVKEFLDLYEDMALKSVKKDGEFWLMNIGKLIKQKRAARMGRNPQTGAAIKIAAKTVVKFRVAKAAKDAVL
ncbi:MAG: HU family DNA-binding protein [Patescibacteria group bacterium]